MTAFIKDPYGKEIRTGDLVMVPTEVRKLPPFESNTQYRIGEVTGIDPEKGTFTIDAHPDLLTSWYTERKSGVSLTSKGWDEGYPSGIKAGFLKDGDRAGGTKPMEFKLDDASDGFSRTPVSLESMRKGLALDGAFLDEDPDIGGYKPGRREMKTRSVLTPEADPAVASDMAALIAADTFRLSPHVHDKGMTAAEFTERMGEGVRWERGYGPSAGDPALIERGSVRERAYRHRDLDAVKDAKAEIHSDRTPAPKPVEEPEAIKPTVPDKGITTVVIDPEKETKSATVTGGTEKKPKWKDRVEDFTKEAKEIGEKPDGGKVEPKPAPDAGPMTEEIAAIDERLERLEAGRDNGIAYSHYNKFMDTYGDGGWTRDKIAGDLQARQVELDEMSASDPDYMEKLYNVRRDEMVYNATRLPGETELDLRAGEQAKAEMQARELREVGMDKSADAITAVEERVSAARATLPGMGGPK